MLAGAAVRTSCSHGGYIFPHAAAAALGSTGAARRLNADALARPTRDATVLPAVASPGRQRSSTSAACVLWYAEVMDLPMREISPLMGIEPHAVSALLSRARSGLRTTYDLQTQSAQRLRNADIGKEASNGDSIPAI